MKLSPPQTIDEIRVSFPAEHVLQITFNRPRSLNAMSAQMTRDMRSVLSWFDAEPSLWVVIVTGTGRAFCAGADLKAWNDDQESGTKSEQESLAADKYGFGAISRRVSSGKPIIAAVNGLAMGGGVEMLTNCDIVVASEDAKFALPEVKRGVVAGAGGIPRLARSAGHQLASEMLLTGKTISAKEARDRFRFVNKVVPSSSVLPEALQFARAIIENSPDAVQSSKRALILANRHGVEEAFEANIWAPESSRVYKGENIKEGLNAFVEKRRPIWKNPAKL